MNNRNKDEKDELHLPADINGILVKYGYLLKSYVNFGNKESTFANFKRTNKRLAVLFPFIEHPIHGITGLHAVKIYNEAGYVRLYQYHWKIIAQKWGLGLIIFLVGETISITPTGRPMNIKLLLNHIITITTLLIERKEGKTMMFEH